MKNKELKVKELLNSLGIEGEPEVCKVLSDDCCLFKCNDNMFIIGDRSGKVIDTDIYCGYKKISAEVILTWKWEFPVLAENTIYKNKKLIGIFDIVTKTKIVENIFDNAELVYYVPDKCEMVNLYNGVNCYTLDLNDLDSGVNINPYLSEHTTKVIQKTPWKFLNLDSAYFVDNNGDFRTTEIEKLKKLAEKGYLQIVNDLIKYGGDYKKAIEGLKIFSKKLERKINNEKSCVENNKKSREF